MSEVSENGASCAVQWMAAVGRSATARAATAFALVLVMAPVQSAQSGAVDIEAARDGDAINIHASAFLNADAGTAWRVLTDYNRYTEFVPDLHFSRVVARHDGIVTVEQSGAAALWLFKLPLDVTFEIHEVPPRILLSRAVAGSLRGLTSRYALTPVQRGMRLDYVGRVVPGFEPLGRFEQNVVEQNVARQFQALADEIERQSVAAGSDPMAVPK